MQTSRTGWFRSSSKNIFWINNVNNNCCSSSYGMPRGSGGGGPALSSRNTDVGFGSSGGSDGGDSRTGWFRSSSRNIFWINNVNKNCCSSSYGMPRGSGGGGLVLSSRNTDVGFGSSGCSDGGETAPTSRNAFLGWVPTSRNTFLGWGSSGIAINADDTSRL
jgi:hypothetical protein